MTPSTSPGRTATTSRSARHMAGGGPSSFNRLWRPRVPDKLSAQDPGLGMFSPAGESPYFHALAPAALAATYLGIPAGAELIKALMRGILPAIGTEAAEPLGWVAQKNFTARSAVPISERCKLMFPAAETIPQHRGKATSLEKAAEGERQGGTGDHRVLLRDASNQALIVPAGWVAAA